MDRLAHDDPTAVDRFWQVIEAGGIAAYPTDTLYGIGVDATNEAAVDRLMTLKGRVGPFGVMVGSVSLLEQYTLLSTSVRDKLLSVLPGPFTFIMKPKENCKIVNSIKGPQGGIGFRVPDHSFIGAIYTANMIPVITTSANLTGEAPILDPSLIEAKFGGSLDLLIDGGQLAQSGGSTVIDTTTEPWSIVRQGDGEYAIT